MADTRYETLKKAVTELLEAQGNTNTLETVKDITSMMDKMADNEPENANNITREEIMAVKDDGERVKLISENYHLFNGGR